jgi:hypothetical protein
LKKGLKTGAGAGLLLIISIFIFISCKKEPQELGLDLVESNPLEVEVSDTTTVIAYSMPEDSIRTDETGVSLLGSIYDPVFGKTTAVVFSQIGISSLRPDFGTNPVCDSVIFSILYSGYYGDTSTIQTLRFYEITETLDLDTSYYSHQTVTTNPAELGYYTFSPRPTDSVLIDTIKYEPHLRCVMGPDLGNKILSADTSAFTSVDNFKEFFKGIALIPDQTATAPGQGSILYLNFYGNISKINIYYHNDEEDSLVYRLSVNSTTHARFGHFDHFAYEDAAAGFRQQVIDGDTTLGASQIYLQSMAGVKTQIQFPFLKNWVNDYNIAINEAQLIFYDQSPDTAIFTPPAKLALYNLNEEGKLEFLDDQLESDTYFDGVHEGTRYRFRINRYIQGILTGGQTSKGLVLFSSGASVNASRVIINGYGSESERITLRLVYTKPNI